MSTFGGLLGVDLILVLSLYRLWMSLWMEVVLFLGGIILILVRIFKSPKGVTMLTEP